MSEPSRYVRRSTALQVLVVGGVLGVCIAIGAVAYITLYAPKSSAVELSPKACETALTFMGLHHDPIGNPPGVNHSNTKDFDGILRIRKQCQESNNRMDLVKRSMRNDELTAAMLEEMAKTVKNFQDTAKLAADLLLQDPESYREMKSRLRLDMESSLEWIRRHPEKFDVDPM